MRLPFFIHGRDALHKGDFRQGKAGRVSKLVAGGGGGRGRSHLLGLWKQYSVCLQGMLVLGGGKPRWAQAERKQAQV